MKAWSSFEACDINYDGSLSIVELKNLLWLFEEEEPNQQRVEKELKSIDKDYSEQISKDEWLSHLCSIDKDTGQ